MTQKLIALAGMSLLAGSVFDQRIRCLYQSADERGG